MEKLIELLNEFETSQSGIVFKSYDDYDGTFYGVDIDGETEIAWSDSLICSKKFGWIGWLVENDKIDLKKLYKKEIESGWSFEGPKTDSEDLLIEFANQYNTEIALMLLSISDTPIDDLISYLK